MKRIISLLMCILVLLQVWIAMLNISNEQIIQMGNMEKSMLESFCIPDDDEICQPSKLFAAMKDTANETGGNIIRSMFLGGDNSNKYEIVKYVLFADESEYYNFFDIVNGEMLGVVDTQTEGCPRFVSTKKTTEQNQTGTIKSNMYHMDVTLRPLTQQFSYYKANGLYYVELTDGISISDFLQVLQKNINLQCGVSIDVEDLEGDADITGIPYTDLSVYYILLAVIVFFTVLFVLYYLLQKKRDISVMQLMGIKKNLIFVQVLQEPLITYPIFLGIISFVVFVIKGDVDYTGSLVCMAWIAYIFILLFFFLTFYQICKPNELIAAIKGNVYTKRIYVLNIIAEMVCILLLVYTGESIYSDIINLNVEKSMYEDWEVASDYGVFYPYYIGNELTDTESLEREIIINTEFYKLVNAQGALYINAKEYENEYIQLNEDAIANSYEQSIRVNPNYLIKYPVLDENGNAIEISESETNLVLLVPSMYKKNSSQIIDYYRDNHEGYREIDEDVYGIENQDDFEQEIKIIWVQDDQSVFCFNTNVNNENGSYVVNPIIQVLTENNCYVSEIDCILGAGNTDPLKIKLNGNSKETYNLLYSTLEALGLEDNLTSLVSVDEQIVEIISGINSGLMLAIRIAVAIVLVFVFLIYQSTALNFNQNKKDYTAKKLFGWHWREIYGKYCIKKLFLLLILFLLYGVFTGFKHSGYIIFVATFLLAVQIIIIWCCTTYQEHKKLQDVLKGA